MPWQNHSWHSTLYLSPRGLTTGSIPYNSGLFEIEFDFVNERLRINSTFSGEESMLLGPRSVADFYRELMEHLDDMGIPTKIHAAPNEVEPSIPFAENEDDCYYDSPKVKSFWKILLNIHNVFQEFRSGFTGKCSPVHFFWGAFDLAYTRFSGRPAPLHPGEAPNMPKEVMQEAYSQEVFSVGFWPGNDAFPTPVFYAYCYPTPADFKDQKIEPAEAWWSDDMGEFFLAYADVSQAEDPGKMLMDFLQSTYEAASHTAQWDRQKLERFSRTVH